MRKKQPIVSLQNCKRMKKMPFLEMKRSETNFQKCDLPSSSNEFYKKIDARVNPVSLIIRDRFSKTIALMRSEFFVIDQPAVDFRLFSYSSHRFLFFFKSYQNNNETAGITSGFTFFFFFYLQCHKYVFNISQPKIRFFFKLFHATSFFFFKFGGHRCVGCDRNF